MATVKPMNAWRWLAVALLLAGIPALAGADIVVMPDGERIKTETPLDAERVLVTRDGAVIETIGPWLVSRGVVVFQDHEQKVSSVGMLVVDLEASLEANLDPEAFRARRAEEKARAPIEITDDNLERGDWGEWNEQAAEDRQERMAQEAERRRSEKKAAAEVLQAFVRFAEAIGAEDYCRKRYSDAMSIRLCVMKRKGDL